MQQLEGHYSDEERQMHGIALSEIVSFIERYHAIYIRYIYTISCGICYYFFIRTTKSSEMADVPKITFRSSGIQTDL